MTDPDDPAGPDAKRHPIQVVVRRTGLTADRLRAWEKRYGVVEPGRSEGDRRLYSDEDIERLRLLHRAILGGRRIGQVAELTTDRLAELVREDEREEVEAPPEPEEVGAAREYVDEGITAMERLDAGELESVLTRAVVTLGAAAAVERVAAPLMQTIGEAWCEGSILPAHEHLASAVVGRVLGELIGATEPAEPAARIVVATPATHRHEFGALFAAAAAALAGWRAVYLGADLPADDIARIVREVGARAVALSLVYPEGSSEVAEELRRLRGALPADVTVIVGGRAAPSYRGALQSIDALELDGIAELRARLLELG